MDAPTPAPNPQQQAIQEEKVWRDKEEHLKEMTYDQEMKEKDQSVQNEESELMNLRNYSLDTLASAGVITLSKRDELAASGIHTFLQLVEFLNQQR